MSGQYSGKNILITGASSGIGAEFARQFHALGANLILVARRADKLEALCSELNEKRPGSARYWNADLTLTENGSESAAGLEEVCRRIGSEMIDVLVNNAGVGSFGQVGDMDFGHERQIILLNVYAATKILHAAAKQMRERRSGEIISVSSVAGIQPLPYMATYSASKAFNMSQALAVREELREFGVKVITLCPGPTETEFFGVARVPGKPTGIKRDRAEDVVRLTIAALRKGKPCVVTGVRAKLMALGSMLVPYRLSCRIMGKLLKSSLPGADKV